MAITVQMHKATFGSMELWKASQNGRRPLFPDAEEEGLADYCINK
ncbi:hypothetical protein GA0061070_1001228 [Kosakonia oryziphila]|uniref:Uncharacterized protein n=1 Tax=Kosakonia oryziphila TaxID=1005667 RepID=A0A1C3ZAX4_9ENTR|nr:hypothetical protein GA0061070_1001228 [Kosakonia oryziphila]